MRFDPAYAALAFLASAWALAAATAHPPQAPGEAAPGSIDVARAEAHVAAIAATPHMSGTPANAAVRDYLLAELRALGMEPRVQAKRVPASPFARDLSWLEPGEGAAEDVERDDAGRGPSPDLVAAATYARKRRIGPYRRRDRGEQRQRDLARLARQGYSFEIARTVIDAATVEALLELVEPAQ